MAYYVDGETRQIHTFRVTQDGIRLDDGREIREPRSGMFATLVAARAHAECVPLLRCVSDAYDRSGAEPYAGIDDFNNMCRECFGVAPSLTYQVGDVWTDVDGSRVLEPWFKA